MSNAGCTGTLNSTSYVAEIAEVRGKKGTNSGEVQVAKKPPPIAKAGRREFELTLGVQATTQSPSNAGAERAEAFGLVKLLLPLSRASHRCNNLVGRSNQPRIDFHPAVGVNMWFAKVTHDSGDATGWAGQSQRANSFH